MRYLDICNTILLIVLLLWGLFETLFAPYGLCFEVRKATRTLLRTDLLCIQAFEALALSQACMVF